MPFSKQTIWQPILAITLIATLAFSVSLWLLYNTAFQRQLRDLEQTATILANILEAMAQHNQLEHIQESSNVPWHTTMNQLYQGLQSSRFKPGDEELTIGYRSGDVIKMMRKNEHGDEKLEDIPYDSKLAQPMYKALQGKSGNEILNDYAGVKVLAGYAPVPSLKLGIVFKIPVTQMQAPYIQSASWAGAILLIMLGIFITGFLLFRQRVSIELVDTQKYAHRAESLAQAMLDKANVLVVILDHEGRICQFNTASENLSGYSLKEVKGKFPWDIFLPPEEADTIRAQAFEALVTNPQTLVGNYTNYWLSKQGKRSLTYWSNSLLLDDEGKMEYMISIGTDITEQKHQEDLLAASNQLLNAVFNTTPVLIAYLDVDMNFVRVNHAYAEADKKTPDYFVGKNHFELYPNAENEAIFRRVVETGISHSAKAKSFEYENSPERGVSHWDWALSPIKDNTGQVIGLVLSLLNVTDHINALEALEISEKKLVELNNSLDHDIMERKAELETQTRRNELILGTTLEGYFAADINGRVCVANPAFCKLIGYTQKELFQMHISEFEANEDANDVAAHIEKIIATGHDVFDTRHRCKDGRIVDVEISVNLVEIAGEKMFYAFVHDISQRKQNEKELMMARDAAQQANLAKSEFLARMSHELRTPMNAILGFAQVLELQKLTPPQQDYVQEIHDAGSHLLALINELLDLSCIESGKLSLFIQSINVKSIISQAIPIVKPMLNEKNITLINECNEKHVMLADPTRLLQILVNLLSNSAKYNINNGYINVDCERHSNNMLRLSITDTGVGIAQENMSKIFQPFERLGAEHSGVDGTGIGLALSQQLARLMGGSLGVVSTPNKGSTFWLELPLASSPTPKTDSNKITETAIVDKSKQIVLYVEDNIANLKLVEALFQYHPNLCLLSATNGSQGLELAQQHLPDVILLDIHLPDINGFNVLAELKSNDATRHIPVIALSADAMPLDVDRGLKAGFNSYLTKPFKIDLLIASLENVLTK